MNLPQGRVNIEKTVESPKVIFCPPFAPASFDPFNEHIHHTYPIKLKKENHLQKNALLLREGIFFKLLREFLYDGSPA